MSASEGPSRHAELLITRNFDSELELAHARSDALARARDLACDLAHSLSDTCDSARGPAIIRDLASVRGRAEDLANTLAALRNLALLDVRVDGRDLVLDLARIEHRYRADDGLARELANAYDLAEDLANALAHVHSLARIEHRYRRRARRVVPPAAGLLAAAARLLPAADRTRYADEYRSELRELAQSGAGRCRQLGYALRQLRSTPQMRFALHAPRRRSAAP